MARLSWARFRSVLRSRMPASDICRVRGMGVAVRVRTSTDAPHLLHLSLCRDPEAMLLVDDHQPQIAEDHVFWQQAMGADDDIDVALP